MKYFISFIFCQSLFAATPYFLINTTNREIAESLRDKLENKYGVNKEFTKIVSGQCLPSSQFLAAQLCLNKKGELKILSLNKKILMKSKEIFKRLK